VTRIVADSREAAAFAKNAATIVIHTALNEFTVLLSETEIWRKYGRDLHASEGAKNA